MICKRGMSRTAIIILFVFIAAAGVASLVIIRNINLLGINAPSLSPEESIEEGCYLSFEINEVKNGENIGFSLLSQENIYGAYSGMVNIYNPEIGSNYILKTFDINGNLLNQCALYSSRFILYDTFNETDPGGIIETNDGLISAIIPYDNRINRIKIDNNGVETDLGVNTAEFRCIRTCKVENEIVSLWCDGADTNKDGNVDDYDSDILSGNYGRDDCSGDNSWCDGADTNKDGNVDDYDSDILSGNYGRDDCSEAGRCCLGFTPSFKDRDDGSFVCTKCGDGICSDNEDSYSCYEDCPREFTCTEGYVKGEFECLLP